MKLRRVKSGLSAWETADGKYHFVRAPGPGMLLVWFVFANDGGEDTPLWSKGFWTLKEAKEKLQAELSS